MSFGSNVGGPIRRNTARPAAYTRVQATLHWVVVALLIAQYNTSGAIVRTHQMHMIGQRQNPNDLLLHVLHNRVGLLLTGLMVARLAYRLWAGAPVPAGQAEGALTARLAGLVHGLFYAVLITEGVTGAAASYFWWPASTAHVILFKLLLGLIALHVAAVLWHQLVLKDRPLGRMGIRPLFLKSNLPSAPQARRRRLP